MPSRWAIRFELDGVEQTTTRQLHGLLSSWLEADATTDEHRAPRKPFSTSPLEHVDGSLWQITVGLLDDALAQRLVGGLARSGGTIRLGTTVGRVVLIDGRPAECVDAATWQELRDRARPAERIALRFHTPTTFRSGQLYQPLPAPGSVFGHYRAVWETFDPRPDEPPIDLADLGLHVLHLAGETSTARVTRGKAVGFVGDVTYAAATTDDDDRRALDRLAAIAEFAGTGARTTMGLGVTERLPDQRTRRRR